MADPNEQSLKWSRPHAQAENGANGSSQEKLGRNGKNLILRVPCGVVVRKIVKPGEDMYDDREEGADEDSVDENNANPLPSDDETKQKQNAATAFSSWDVKRDEENNAGVEFFPLDDDDGDDPFDDFDSENMNNTDEIDSNPSQQKKIYLIDLDKPGAHIMVARGGRGGYGSMMYASDHGPLPEARILIANAQPAPPEVTYLELELKLIADVGTIGFPNAGMYGTNLPFMDGACQDNFASLTVCPYNR